MPLTDLRNDQIRQLGVACEFAEYPALRPRPASDTDRSQDTARGSYEAMECRGSLCNGCRVRGKVTDTFLLDTP